MANITFPYPPTLNQVYSFGGATWRYNGVGWVVQPLFVSATPGSVTPVSVLTSVSGVLTIDLSLGDMYTLPLLENVTSVVFSNMPAAGYGTAKSIRIQQPMTGGPYGFAKPASFKAVVGSDTNIQIGAGSYTDLMIKTYDQGVRWPYVMKAVTL